MSSSDGTTTAMEENGEFCVTVGPYLNFELLACMRSPEVRSEVIERKKYMIGLLEVTKRSDLFLGEAAQLNPFKPKIS